MDFLHILNAWRTSFDAPPLKGMVIKRNPKEVPVAFLAKVSKTINTSVKNGFVPIMSVRSAKAEDMGERFL